MTDMENLIGVQPSDKTDCGVLEGVAQPESGRCGESLLVYGSHDIPQQCALPQEDGLKDAKGAMFDDHLAKTTQLSSDTRNTSYVHQNQKTHIKWKSVISSFASLVPYFKMCLLLFLACYPNCVSAEQTCYRVLPASDVERETSNFLNFHQGQYKEIEEDAFDSAEAVERLDISNNCLRVLPDDVFKNMIDLIEIDISRNKFSDFPLALQRPDYLKKLLSLNLMYNSIRYLGKDDFKGKEAILSMNFDDNMIQIIHDAALDHLPALESATFSGNVLTAIPQLNLTLLGKLKFIYFSNNTLQSLKIDHFSNFPEVTSITIRNESMTLIIRTDREVVFWIDGNKNLSCEESMEEISKSKKAINFNFLCQFRNGSYHQLEGTKLPQNYSTVKPDVSYPTPGSLTNDQCRTYVGLWVFCGVSVFLYICFVAIATILHCKGFACRRSKIVSEGKEVGDETKNGSTRTETNGLMNKSKP